MHNTHVHQPCTSTMCQKIWSMKCIHHMTTLSINRIYHTKETMTHDLCLFALSSNIGLFSRYASDKYLLLESWEEEWLPLTSLQDEQYATLWRSLDLFMHQTCAIPFIIKQNICQQWNSRIMNNISTKCIMYQNVPTMHNTHVHQPCTSIMCQKISSMKCIHHMPIINYAKHVHLPICQPCASSNMIQPMCIYQS